ncbi:MAG TPA: YdeI/OmpD-associated family protein [Lacibacter sp.]|nr:YdeI/OmpD-associated family protein [Lacibacter sp.]HMO89033.1 YdeI/OmpD-associated family protein [Lacibacter sp.]
MRLQLERFPHGVHFIRVPSKTAELFIGKGSRRVLCTINQAPPFHCAFMRTKEGDYYVHLGTSQVRKMKLKAGSSVAVRFSEDVTEHQFEVPEEFAAVLESDPEAEALFRKLTPGNQRGLLYLVTRLRSSEKRIERSLHIAEKMKAGITSPRAM